jgi:hypothetical protein
MWASITSMTSGRLDFANGQRFGVGCQVGERSFQTLVTACRKGIEAGAPDQRVILACTGFCCTSHTRHA